MLFENGVHASTPWPPREQNLKKGENVKTKLLMCKSLGAHHFQILSESIPLSFVSCNDGGNPTRKSNF